VDSNSLDFHCLIANPQIVQNHKAIKLIKDTIKRDFGTKTSNFVKRVALYCEVGNGVNDINKSNEIYKKKGYLFQSFKIKPTKERNNFLSILSLENIINRYIERDN
jgi:hypothetical protein